MKQIILALFVFLPYFLFSQSVEELKTKQDDLRRLKAYHQNKVDSLFKEIVKLEKQINEKEVEEIKIDPFYATTVSDKVIFLRNKPNYRARIIYQIPKNTKVKISGIHSTYFKVEYKEYTGYVSETNLVKTEKILSIQRGKKEVKFTNKPVDLSVTRLTDGLARFTQPRSTSKTYIRGPKGGCYYINSNGNKTYVDRSLCGSSKNSYSLPARPKTKSSYRTYIKGSRGGCYYINKNGNKTYVDRSLCN